MTVCGKIVYFPMLKLPQFMKFNHSYQGSSQKHILADEIVYCWYTNYALK